jgi:Trk K+ transport system NAD-binding subunit
MYIDLTVIQGRSLLFRRVSCYTLAAIHLIALDGGWASTVTAIERRRGDPRHRPPETTVKRGDLLAVIGSFERKE